jgi:hypothetical protein
MEHIHPFELAGLGKAPFRIIGVEEKVGPLRYTTPDGIMVEVGAPGQPMGCCAFCGQGIKECWSIKSQDNKVFIVGCDCVRKTVDPRLISALDKKKSKLRKEKADKKCLELVNSAEEELKNEAVRNSLSAQIRSEAPSWANDRSMLSYVEFLLSKGGRTGKTKAAKIILEAASFLNK